MYVGLTNTINSLYCVKKMVFDRNNVTTLEVLRMALMNNWGEKYVTCHALQLYISLASYPGLPTQPFFFVVVFAAVEKSIHALHPSSNIT